MAVVDERREGEEDRKTRRREEAPSRTPALPYLRSERPSQGIQDILSLSCSARKVSLPR